MTLVISLATISIAGGVLIAGFLIVRRKVLLPALPTLPPSGAAPWKRERTGDVVDPAPFAFPASAGTRPAPITEPISSQPQLFQSAPAYLQPRANPLASPDNAPVPGYTGLVNQGFTPQMQGFPFPQPAPLEASPVSQVQQLGLNRPRLRRNSLLHGANSQPALPSISMDADHGLSADPQALSDPHLQALIRQYSQNEQAVRQSGQQQPDVPFTGV